MRSGRPSTNSLCHTLNFLDAFVVFGVYIHHLWWACVVEPQLLNSSNEFPLTPFSLISPHPGIFVHNLVKLLLSKCLKMCLNQFQNNMSSNWLFTCTVRAIWQMVVYGVHVCVWCIEWMDGWMDGCTCDDDVTLYPSEHLVGLSMLTHSSCNMYLVCWLKVNSSNYQLMTTQFPLFNIKPQSTNSETREKKSAW